MPVRRPNIGASDPREDQRRGPRPGQGTNAGDGAVDGADRTGQGLANDRINESRTFIGEGEAGSTRLVSGPPDRSRGVAGGSDPWVPNNVTGIASNVRRSQFSGLFDAQGNPFPTSAPVAQRMAAAGQGGGGFPGLTPPGFEGPDFTGTTVSDETTTTRGSSKIQPSPMPGVGDEDALAPVTTVGDGDTGAGEFADVNAIEQALRTGRAEQIAETFLDPITLQVRVEYPMWNGEVVFYGQNERGVEGYGVLANEDVFDENGNLIALAGEFLLAPGNIQNQAVAIREGIEFSSKYLSSTIGRAQDTVVAEYTERLRDELQRQRNVEGQEFQTGEREAGEDFQAGQAELDRSFQQRLQNEQREFDNYWNERNEALRESESALDRGLQIAIFEMNNGIRFGDFDTARQRADQEIQIRNAQFALQLLQTIGAAPELLLQMRESGFLEQVQQATGLNLSLFAAVPDAEAGSALAQVDLPSLAEFQQMPADLRDRIVTTLSARTGVKRDIIVQEIQRRSSGIGLGAGTDFRRIPVGA